MEEYRDQFKTPVHIFATNFEEELAGLHGKLLTDQATYINDCIRYIQSLYQDPVPVVLVTHSMGGMAARAAFLQPNYVSHSIQTIVTLSTPHRYHPILYDPSLYLFYTKVNTHWLQLCNSSKAEMNQIAMISISGGARDNLITNDQTLLDGMLCNKENGFHINAYSIIDMKHSADHMCIVWCRQLIHNLAVALLQMAQKPNPYQLTVKERLQLFANQLQNKFDRKSFAVQTGIASETVLKPLEDLLPILETKIAQNENKIAAVLTNLNRKDFDLYGLTFDQIHEKEEKQKFHKLDLIDSLPFYRKDEEHREVDDYDPKIAHSISLLAESVVSKYTRIVAKRKRQSSKQQDFFINVIRGLNHTFEHDIALKDLLLQPQVNIPFQKELGGIHFVRLAELPWEFSYKIQINYRNRSCSDFTNYPVAHVTSSDKTQERFFEDARDFVVRFAPRETKQVSNTKGFDLKLFLHPQCEAQVTISISWISILFTVFRYFIPQLITNVYLICWIAFAVQIVSKYELNFGDALQKGAFVWVPAVILLQVIVRSSPLAMHTISHYDYLLHQSLGVLPHASTALEEWYELFTTHSGNTFYNHPVYIIFAMVAAYGAVFALHQVLSILINIVLRVAVGWFSSLLHKWAIILKLVFVVLCPILLILSVSFIHTLLPMSLFLIYQLFIISSGSLKSNNPAQWNRLYSIVLFTILLMVFQAPSAIIWWKEFMLTYREVMLKNVRFIEDVIWHMMNLQWFEWFGNHQQVDRIYHLILDKVLQQGESFSVAKSQLQHSIGLLFEVNTMKLFFSGMLFLLFVIYWRAISAKKTVGKQRGTIPFILLNAILAAVLIASFNIYRVAMLSALVLLSLF